LSEVLSTINDLAAEVRAITGTPVLLVFDDTDKPEPARARDVFFNHADVLTDFNASAIYTFPIELVYTQDFVPFGQKFDGCSRLPNWKTATRHGAPHEPGIDKLRKLIACRMLPDLITHDARERLIAASGGHTRSLIQLLRLACVRGTRQPSGQIGMAEADAAIANLRGDFVGTLAMEQYAWLAARHRDKELSRDSRTQELLYSLALLEYKNSDWWCDVHPIVLPLMEARAGNGDAEV
jgi:hypothetical protein